MNVSVKIPMSDRCQSVFRTDRGLLGVGHAPLSSEAASSTLTTVPGGKLIPSYAGALLHLGSAEGLADAVGSAIGAPALGTLTFALPVPVEGHDPKALALAAAHAEDLVTALTKLSLEPEVRAALGWDHAMAWRPAASGSEGDPVDTPEFRAALVTEAVARGALVDPTEEGYRYTDACDMWAWANGRTSPLRAGSATAAITLDASVGHFVSAFLTGLSNGDSPTAACEALVTELLSRPREEITVDPATGPDTCRRQWLRACELGYISVANRALLTGERGLAAEAYRAAAEPTAAFTAPALCVMPRKLASVLAPLFPRALDVFYRMNIGYFAPPPGGDIGDFMEVAPEADLAMQDALKAAELQLNEVVTWFAWGLGVQPASLTWLVPSATWDLSGDADGKDAAFMPPASLSTPVYKLLFGLSVRSLATKCRYLISEYGPEFYNHGIIPVENDDPFHLAFAQAGCAVPLVRAASDALEDGQYRVAIGGQGGNTRYVPVPYGPKTAGLRPYSIKTDMVTPAQLLMEMGQGWLDRFVPEHRDMPADGIVVVMRVPEGLVSGTVIVRDVDVPSIPVSRGEVWHHVLTSDGRIIHQTFASEQVVLQYWPVANLTA